MAKNARSIALDNAIEDELKAMLALGLTEAPISASTLHPRLKEKGIIKGGLSTLSKPDRKAMIDEYRGKQVAVATKNQEITESGYKYGSVGYYKDRNRKLNAELSKKKSQLSRNTEILVAIVNRVESSTPVKVEDLVSQYLVQSDGFDPDEDVPLR